MIEHMHVDGEVGTLPSPLHLSSMILCRKIKTRQFFFHTQNVLKIVLRKLQNLTVMKTTQYTEMLVTVKNVIVNESSKEETHLIRTVCGGKKYW